MHSTNIKWCTWNVSRKAHFVVDGYVSEIINFSTANRIHAVRHCSTDATVTISMARQLMIIICSRGVIYFSQSVFSTSIASTPFQWIIKKSTKMRSKWFASTKLIHFVSIFNNNFLWLSNNKQKNQMKCSNSTILHGFW